MALPDVPEDIAQCFSQYTKLPRGKWTVEMASEISARLIRHEVVINDCGQRLIAFYRGLQRGLAK